MQEANNARWREYGKLITIEMKFQKKILEDHGPRPSSPEPMFHSIIPGSQPMDRGERASLAEPRTGEDVGYGWRIDQSAQ